MHYSKAKGILSKNNGINIFRGCTHGCIYCDSRSDCYNMQHDFEDVEIKENAVELLEQALKKKRKKCMIGTGAMSDPYIHLESDLKLARKCLEVIDKYHFGLAIQTKSDRILGDLDLLKKINANTKCVVQMTLTTFDEALCKVLEPHVSTTKERFEVLKVMRDNQIPTVVWLDPILPFINDTMDNLEGIMAYCIEAKVHGIICFGFGLTLRDGNREYFYQELDKHFPGMKQRYQSKYGYRYDVMSEHNESLMKRFKQLCKENHILSTPKEVFRYMNTYEDKTAPIQLSLFDD